MIVVAYDNSESPDMIQMIDLHVLQLTIKKNPHYPHERSHHVHYREGGQKQDLQKLVCEEIFCRSYFVL